MVSRRRVGVAGSFLGQLSFKYWIARCDAVLRPLNLVRCCSLRDVVWWILSALHDPKPAGPGPQERSPGRSIAGPRTVGCAGAEAPLRWEDCATAGATAMMDKNATEHRSDDASLSRIVISNPPLVDSILPQNGDKTRSRWMHRPQLKRWSWIGSPPKGTPCLTSCGRLSTSTAAATTRLESTRSGRGCAHFCLRTTSRLRSSATIASAMPSGRRLTTWRAEPPTPPRCLPVLPPPP